jgi:hypothetical protein
VFCEGAERMPEEEEEWKRKRKRKTFVGKVFDKMWLREDVSL